MNPHLRFKLKLTTGTEATTITPAGCIDSIFGTLDVYQGSNILLESKVSPTERAYHWNVCNSTAGTRTGVCLELAAAGSKSQC